MTNVDQIRNQYAPDVLKSGCALSDHLTLEQLSNYEFIFTQDQKNLLAGMLFSLKAERDLLQVDTSSQIFRKQRLRETIGPFDGEGSRCTRQKFTSSKILKDGTIISSNRRNPQEDLLDGEQINSYFAFFFAIRRTTQCAKSMDGFDRSRRRWTNFFSRDLSSSSSLHGNDERNSDFFKGTEERYIAISARHGQKCSSLRKVQARILHVHWSRFGKTWHFEKYFDDPKGKWMNWQNK